MPPVMHTPSNPTMRAKLSGPALRIFFRIAKRWNLTDRDQMAMLGLTDQRTLHRWRVCGNSRLQRDTLERISYVLGIYKAINILLPIPERADVWVSASNHGPLFNGSSALARMTGGNVSDLFVVRQYLDAQLI